MKFERIIWGVLLLFVGGVLLLDNLNIIEFYWRSVWSFWPIFLIIAGVNMLLNKKDSQTGSIISLVILIIALGFLFVRGQQKPSRGNLWSSWKDGEIETFEDVERAIDGDSQLGGMHFAEAFLPSDSVKKAVLSISGGGVSFDLKDETDSLFEANVERKRGKFALTKQVTDSVNTLSFKMGEGKTGKDNWDFNSTGNNVKISLNKSPIWALNLSLGAGELDFSLENHKVRTLNFDGGAADVKLKVGELLPITDVNVKTGVANVEIKVPSSSGCRINTNTGLAAKDFKGFIKISDGVYETPNYKTSKNKVFIKLDGGLSNFDVDTY
jgi:hypothetical protein